VKDIIRTACDAAGVDKPYRGVGERRQNEIESTIADIRHINAAVGWTPKIPFREGLGDLIERMRAQ
jgi:nucleoside-diphosphate-sugar epimerase